MKYEGYLFLPFQGQLRFAIYMFADIEQFSLVPANMEQNSLFPNTNAPTCYFYNEEEENNIRVNSLRALIPLFYKEMALRRWPKYYTRHFDKTSKILDKIETHQGYVILRRIHVPTGQA
mgnify:CR=1 FL=1